MENSLSYSRFAVIVPKRWGKAVRRNRARRVLREVLRTSRDRFKAGIDFVLLAKPGLDVEDHPLLRRRVLGFLETSGLLRRPPGEAGDEP